VADTTTCSREEDYMEQGFEITERTEENTPVLSVRGEIDVSTAPTLRDHLVQTSQRGHETVVVDLAEVTFLDSTALGVLVGGLKRFRAAGGELRLVVTGRNVSKVLEITGLDDVFPVYQSVEQAAKG
jgi:anti-sigma B factor antagonist